MISKDQSIVTQVAFKAATDIAVAAGGDITTLMSNLAIAFDLTKSILNDEHKWDEQTATAAVIRSFPGSTVETVPASSVRIAGRQHGEVPEWLTTAAVAAGVSEVWDNRDKLSENPKRPWFKAVKGEMAFGPPKGR
jgi:hypothetical protein